MRSFNPAFGAAMTSASARPVTLAVFRFDSGDVFVSDRDVAPEGGPEFEGLVVSWGALSARYNGPSGFRMSETSVKLANTGPEPFSARLESCVPERTEVELYQWFEGIPYTGREPLGRFVISSPVVYGEDFVELALTGSMIMRNRVVGSTINRDDYPGADPDAVGRTMNIVYGSVEGLACHGVSAGAATTLSAGIDAAQTSGIALSLAPGETPMPGSGTLQIGREKISFTGIAGKTLTGVTRAVDGTAAAPHRKGETAFEVMASYGYLVAGHPVSSIGDVYVGGVRVESGVTRLADDGGAAMLVFSDKFTLEKTVGLEVDEGSHEHGGCIWSGDGSRTGTYRWTASQDPGWSAGEHVGRAFADSAGSHFFIKANGQDYLDVRSIHGDALAAGDYEGSIIRTQVAALHQDTLSSNFNAPATGVPSSLCDHSWNSYCTIQVSSGYIKTTRSAAVDDKGIIVGAKLCGTYGNSGSATSTGARSEFDGGPFSGQYITGGGPSVQTVRTADTVTKGSVCGWQDFSGSLIKARFTGSGAAAFWEHWVEVYYIPYSGGSSPASGVALTGDSAADIVVGGQVTCDVDGYADDAYGTFTGTPGALIQNPADVVRHFMAVHLDVPAGEFDGSFAAARDTLSGFTAGGYAFAGVLDSPADGLETVSSMCAQSRLAVSHDGFTARVAVLGAGPYEPGRTITRGMVKSGSLSVARTGREEVINRLAVHYKRDLSKGGGTRSEFLDVADSSQAYPSTGDTGSVALYGPRSPRRPFTFGLVRDPEMASDLRDFYISRYKDAARRICFTVFLDNMDIEPGDVIGLDWNTGPVALSGAAFEVEKVSLRPGGLSGARPDELTVQAREV